MSVAHLFGDCLLESLILLPMSSQWRWSVSTGLFFVTDGLPNGMCPDKTHLAAWDSVCMWLLTSICTVTGQGWYELA